MAEDIECLSRLIRKASSITGLTLDLMEAGTEDTSQFTDNLSSSSSTIHVISFMVQYLGASPAAHSFHQGDYGKSDWECFLPGAIRCLPSVTGRYP